MIDGIGITEKVIFQLVLTGSIMIAVLTLIVCLTFKKTTGSLENVMKGPGLPIATVLTIVGAVTLLALVGIVKENTISAIFGGIVGYVLGGIIRKDNEKT